MPSGNRHEIRGGINRDGLELLAKQAAFLAVAAVGAGGAAQKTSAAIIKQPNS